MLVPSVSLLVSLIALISASCPPAEYSQDSCPACACSWHWKRSPAGCSAMVFKNWDGGPYFHPQLNYSRDCSGCLYRVALLPPVPSPPLHVYLKPQLSSVRSYKLLQFWNLQVPMCKQDLEGNMVQGNSRGLLVQDIVWDPKIKDPLIFSWRT